MSYRSHASPIGTLFSSRRKVLVPTRTSITNFDVMTESRMPLPQFEVHDAAEKGSGPAQYGHTHKVPRQQSVIVLRTPYCTPTCLCIDTFLIIHESVSNLGSPFIQRSAVQYHDMRGVYFSFILFTPIILFFIYWAWADRKEAIQSREPMQELSCIARAKKVR